MLNQTQTGARREKNHSARNSFNVHKLQNTEPALTIFRGSIFPGRFSRAPAQKLLPASAMSYRRGGKKNSVVAKRTTLLTILAGDNGGLERALGVCETIRADALLSRRQSRDYYSPDKNCSPRTCDDRIKALSRSSIPRGRLSRRYTSYTGPRYRCI